MTQPSMPGLYARCPPDARVRAMFSNDTPERIVKPGHYYPLREGMENFFKEAFWDYKWFQLASFPGRNLKWTSSETINGGNWIPVRVHADGFIEEPAALPDVAVLTDY